MSKEIVSNTAACLANPAYTLATLVELLRWRASSQPDQVGYIYLNDDAPDASSVTYSELDQKARAIAATLQGLGAARQPVLLLYPPGLEFIAGFFGCLYAGAIAVPAYPPDVRRLSRTLPRLQSIVTDTCASLCLGTSTVLSLAEKAFAIAPSLKALRAIATDELQADIGAGWSEPDVDRDSVAFLQYTSGSTGNPKGVILTHDNLLHNAALVRAAFEHTAEDKYVSWLPTFHDMGFMAGVLQPLYSGIQAVLMSPESFLRYPLKWLETISKFKATTSGGPNFAYELCARRISPQEREALDLSSWTVAFNGAEPVRKNSIDRFAQTFEASGFRRNTFYPCYGLAEATLIVSGGLKSDPPIINYFKASELEEKRARQSHSNNGDEKSRSLVSCGQILSGQEVLIIDADSLLECPPGQLGEIWINGPSVSSGYWNNPEDTERVFNARLSDTASGPYLRTGDMGFLLDGQLYIAGRIKDLIIIRGLNHYPQDIEATVEESDSSLRKGCCAAFSVDVNAEERLVVVQEVDSDVPRQWDSLIESIRRNVAQQHELQAHSIVLIKKGSIYKTSSGKIQRRACREAFLSGKLDVVALKVEQQVEAEPEALSDSLTVAEIQTRLTDFICARLGLARSEIDPNSPITTYGIDSLLAVELMHSIETKLGIRLPVSRLLEGPSITELAASAWNNKAAHNQLSSEQETTRPDISEFPLSPGQKGLWFISKMFSDNAIYNISRAIRIKSALDVDTLRECFQVLVDRHPMLRAHFTTVDDQPVQRISPTDRAHLQQVDASGWSEEDLKASLLDAAYSPFDLEKPPLLRLSLFTCSPDDHVLLVSIHHIIADFWSLAILFHELGELYSSRMMRTEPALSPPGTHYGDYVRKQAEWLRSAEAERHWQFWQEQLKGDLPVLRLPTDRQRRSSRTHRGASCSFRLSSQLSAQLKLLAEERSATMYMLLLAAFQTLLYRCTQQDDIIVGSATTGRNYAEHNGAVGYFVNPVAVRVDASGEPPFTTFLAYVRKTVLSVLEHQEFPFQVLVERLRPNRVADLSPILEVMFLFQKAPLLDGIGAFALGVPGGSLSLGGLVMESMGLDEKGSQFDLTLFMAEEEGSLIGTFQYDADLFDHATIQRMIGRFETLLQSIAADPAQPISMLALVDDSERNQLLADWSQTSREAAQGECFHELFQAQAEITPHALALVFKDYELTYDCLNQWANRLARCLRELGVGPDKAVGICLEPSASLMIAMLGVLKAGGAFVPLDPEYPDQRLAAIVEDAGISIIITEEKNRLMFEARHLTPVLMDGDCQDISGYSPENLTNLARPQDLAYVMYTSGSTGKPKGVMVTQRGLANYLCWCVAAYDLRRGEGSFVHTSVAFDLTITSLFAPLLAGNKVEILERAPGVESLSSSLSKTTGLSFLKMTPSHLSLLEGEAASEMAARVKLLILGGEALPTEVATKWLRLAPGSRLVNEYGPTETVVGCCAYFLQEDGASGAMIPIGRPIAGTQLYVLDAHLQPAPIGVPGELFIGGVGLARGYMNRPDLTAERFVPNPYADDPGSRMYKSGDQVSYLSDGNLQFLGRADEQVKVRGYRIELQEIEAVLEEHPAITRAAVNVQRQGAESDRLVGYVVLDGEIELKTNELRSYLKERVPDYMVPAIFVFLDSMPLTSNGKLDKKALPPPDGRRPELDLIFVEARDQTERSLADLWMQVLSLNRVGVHDNFFELGGHSLLATQLSSRIGRVFGVPLTVRSIFDHPTIEGLAQAITGMQKQAEPESEPAIQRVSRGSINIETLLNDMKDLA